MVLAEKHLLIGSKSQQVNISISEVEHCFKVFICLIYKCALTNEVSKRIKLFYLDYVNVINDKKQYKNKQPIKVELFLN